MLLFPLLFNRSLSACLFQFLIAYYRVSGNIGSTFVCTHFFKQFLFFLHFIRSHCHRFYYYSFYVDYRLLLIILLLLLLSVIVIHVIVATIGIGQDFYFLFCQHTGLFSCIYIIYIFFMALYFSFYLSIHISTHKQL